MKTINNTQILLKSIDIELKKLLMSDLKNHQSLQKSNNQVARKAV